jgi:hypothetical protein
LLNYPSASVFLDKYLGGFMFQDSSSAPSTTPGVDKLIAAFTDSDLLEMTTGYEQATQRFPDVANNMPQKAAIGVLAAAGILPGMPDNNYHAQSNLTRAQLAFALARYLRLSSGANVAFSDLPSNSDSAVAAGAAVSAGLITPPAANRFGPNDTVSRQEMAVSLAKAFAATSSGITTNQPKVADIQLATGPAASSIQAVVSANYMTVFPDGSFRPTMPVSRAEAAQSLYAAIKDNVK